MTTLEVRFWVQSLMIQLRIFGEDKTFQVNTTSLTHKQTVKKIEGIVCDNSDGDTVDWLTENIQKK